uniref:RNA helicase n=1 Tax=Eutreptiella gymnastica TaxID=73025 RepID=A0A7S1JFQ0_9EUGL
MVFHNGHGIHGNPFVYPYQTRIGDVMDENESLIPKRKFVSTHFTTILFSISLAVLFIIYNLLDTRIDNELLVIVPTYPHVVVSNCPTMASMGSLGGSRLGSKVKQGLSTGFHPLWRRSLPRTTMKRFSWGTLDDLDMIQDEEPDSDVAVDDDDATSLSTKARSTKERKDGGFEAFHLHPALEPGIKRLGFKKPSPVQEAAIPKIMSERANVAIHSYTGSGKTAVFLLPMLSRALQILEEGRPDKRNPTHLIISPSQELSMQILRTARTLLGEDRDWMVQQLIGGANPARQKEEMKKKKPLLVIGTPGRMATLVGTSLGLHHVEMVALDEADALIADTYAEDMAKIMKHLGREVEGGSQYLLASASLSPKALEGVQQRWGMPQMCTVRAEDDAREQIKQQTTMSPTLTHMHVVVEPRLRIDALRRTINALGSPRTLVFMQEAKRLKDTLFRLTAMTQTLTTAILHSEMPKDGRRNAIQGFENGKVQVLVVTDVLARGMDLACDAVINLEMPEDGVTYAHRAGRTGRMGRNGTVVTLISPFQTRSFADLQRKLGVTIPQRALFAGKLVDPSTVPEDTQEQAEGSMLDGVQPSEGTGAESQVTPRTASAGSGSAGKAVAVPTKKKSAIRKEKEKAQKEEKKKQRRKEAKAKKKKQEREASLNKKPEQLIKFPKKEYEWKPWEWKERKEEREAAGVAGASTRAARRAAARARGELPAVYSGAGDEE